mmetsp:Transcript_8133/g.11836  ORF Transcript_8133/g.11836 Transcript_8133/m.11836 type:complete len:243 (-) Transcript_8133:74-802(-)
MIRRLSGMPRRSPLGSVNSLLSSRTLLRFSAHSGSTSPSKIIQCLLSASPFWFAKIPLKRDVKTPSVHSIVVPSRVPYNPSLSMALGSMIYISPLIPSICSNPSIKTRTAVDFPTPTGPTIMTPCLISCTCLSCSIFCTKLSAATRFFVEQISISFCLKFPSSILVTCDPGKTSSSKLLKTNKSSATNFGTTLLHAPSIKTSFSIRARSPSSVSASSLPSNAFRFNPPALTSNVFKARNPKS